MPSSSTIEPVSHWTRCSVVVPAHNEERTIDRLLDALLSDAVDGEFDILVVANGCTDHTADRVRAWGRSVRLLELTESSKHLAMRAAAAQLTYYPVVYVDADVVIAADSVRDLVAAISGPVLATAPQRRLALSGSSPVVRWYYEVWQELPHVRDGLFGRGVIALAEPGQVRVSANPLLLSDDLAYSETFRPSELHSSQ